MTLAFRIIVNEKKAVTCQQALFIVKVFIKCSLHCLLNIFYAFVYVIICIYTCWKPVVLEKQLFLFHVLDLNPIFANQDPPPPPHHKTKKFLHLPLLVNIKSSRMAVLAGKYVFVAILILIPYKCKHVDYCRFKPWSNEAQVIASFNLSWLVKRVIKWFASSRKDLKTAMAFACVWVILQCWNIKLDKTRDYWTWVFVFHGKWSRKICLSLHFSSKCIVSVRKFEKSCDEIWTSSNHSQVIASWWSNEAQVDTS